MNKSKWWVGCWAGLREPSDGKLFIIRKGGPVNGNSWNGLRLTNDESNGWDYLTGDYSQAKIVKQMCDSLHIPYKWNDNLIYHPMIKVYDEQGIEECSTIRANKLRKILNEDSKI